MKTVRRLTAAALVPISIAGPAAAAGPECRAEGEPIQWIADYCMLTLGTDDEIAASDCIGKESKKPFASRCASNRHYKARMCEIVVKAGTRRGTVKQCIDDPSFMGRTVRRGGVGG